MELLGLPVLVAIAHREGVLTTSAGAAEILLVANKPGLTETGGGHGAKGVDFQRWWAVLRMVEMEQANEPDFLLLFEAVHWSKIAACHTQPRRCWLRMP